MFGAYFVGALPHKVRKSGYIPWYTYIFIYIYIYYLFHRNFTSTRLGTPSYRKIHPNLAFLQPFENSSVSCLGHFSCGQFLTFISKSYDPMENLHEFDFVENLILYRIVYDHFQAFFNNEGARVKKVRNFSCWQHLASHTFFNFDLTKKWCETNLCAIWFPFEDMSDVYYEFSIIKPAESKMCWL